MFVPATLKPHHIEERLAQVLRCRPSCITIQSIQEHSYDQNLDDSDLNGAKLPPLQLDPVSLRMYKGLNLREMKSRAKVAVVEFGRGCESLATREQNVAMLQVCLLCVYACICMRVASMQSLLWTCISADALCILSTCTRSRSRTQSLPLTR
jgi:hypothetical protein